MNKNDCIEKILFIICVTFLGMLFAFFRFGEIEIMCKILKNTGLCKFFFWGSIICGALFLIGTITVLFCCPSKMKCIKSIEPFSNDFPAEKMNKSYFVDKNNKSVSSDRSIIYVKDDVDFNDIKFSAIDKVKEIYFCNSSISISTEMLQKLGNAKIFLDGGKREIKIIHTKK